jgi:hypothetical protein
MAMLAALKHQARRLSYLECEFRCNQPVGAASNPVSTEIFAAHMSPSSFRGFRGHPGKNPQNARHHGVSGGYKAFVPNMASKNMMNHYWRPAWK